MAATNESRRGFLRGLAALGVAGQTLATSGSLRAAVKAVREHDAPLPSMAYRKLGRTGFRASRLIFGCGAALSRRRGDAMLEAAFEAGVNTFDVGTGRYYGDAERNLAPFLARHRDEVFLISKSMVYLDVDPEYPVTASEARTAARNWSEIMDESLRDLRVEHIDAYYTMAANNPTLVQAEEIRRAFERARDAGKVSFFGLSTHENAEAVLEAAIETTWYDLATIAITPLGWYDWKNRRVLEGSPPLTELRGILERARDAGMGLIGMKAARALAGRRFLGSGNQRLFDSAYPRELRRSDLSAFQRSYTFVLRNGFDAVNADIQNVAILRENFRAAALAERDLA